MRLAMRIVSETLAYFDYSRSTIIGKVLRNGPSSREEANGR